MASLASIAPEGAYSNWNMPKFPPVYVVALIFDCNAIGIVSAWNHEIPGRTTELAKIANIMLYFFIITPRCTFIAILLFAS